MPALQEKRGRAEVERLLMTVLKVACGTPHSSDDVLPNPARETIAPLKRAKSSGSVAENTFQWQPRAMPIALKNGRRFRKYATIIGQPITPSGLGCRPRPSSAGDRTEATPGDIGTRERVSMRVDDLPILALLCGSVDERADAQSRCSWSLPPACEIHRTVRNVTRPSPLAKHASGGGLR